MQPSSFLAIDFELATPQFNTVCSVGLCLVKDNIIIDSSEYLVQPPNNEYKPINMQIHGITPEHTKNAPTFTEFWETIMRSFLFETNDYRFMYAHNASFDFNILYRCIQEFKLDIPKIEYSCTMLLSKEYFDLKSYGLDYLCNEFSIPLQHHNSESDARACAELAVKMNKMHQDNSRSKIEIYENGQIDSFEHKKILHFESQKETNIKKNIFNSLNAKDYLPNEEPEIEHRFKNKNIVITGGFEDLSKEDVYKWLSNIGAIIQNGVNRNTEILIVGKQIPGIVSADGKSIKEKKALELQSKGQAIEIIRGQFFNELIIND